MDTIDRWLSEPDPAEPSADFAERVMRAVRREAATPPPIGLPWGRLAAGLAAALLCLVLSLFAAIGKAASLPGAGSGMTQDAAQIVALVFFTLALSLVVARTALWQSSP